MKAYQSSNTPYTPLAEFAYDSVLTLAAMLNRTLEILESGNVEETGCHNRTINVSYSLADFDYDSDLMGCLFLSSLRNLTLDVGMV